MYSYGVKHKQPYTEEYYYKYDAADDIYSISHRLCNTPNTTILTAYDYDYGRRIKRRDIGHIGVFTTYQYDIRNQVTLSKSPFFSQQLFYTNGPGTPCYNGNISAMTWSAQGDTLGRGYRFQYDGLNQLTNAQYGEGDSLRLQTDRYSEHVTAYDKNGNIRNLVRHGQTGVENYGVIDSLSICYNGNQLSSVADLATDSAYSNGFDFKHRAAPSSEAAYEYDANGNLTKDLNKGILAIRYNCLNLPQLIEFTNGSTISYLYRADGQKLQTTYTHGDYVFTTAYSGNAIYENGIRSKILTEGEGFVNLRDTVPTYHFFQRDLQGNVRAVYNENREAEEINHYYPLGGIAESTESTQPYKYNAKELNRTNGLNWYDYGARHYDATLGRWHTMDPMAEKYFETSPYAYCSNDPVNRTDPDGRDWIQDRFGSYLWDNAATDQQSTRNGWNYIGTSLPEDTDRYRILEEINGGLYHKNTTNPLATAVNWISGKEVMVEKKAYNPAEDHMMQQAIETGAEMVVGKIAGKVVGEIGSNVLSKSTGKGFATFAEFKKVYGPAGKGNAWHHIVEQNADNLAKFGAEKIHNTKNLIKLPHGKGSIHANVSGYYSSKPDLANGLTVRQWLNTQSYKEQYKFGIETLKRYGWKP